MTRQPLTHCSSPSGPRDANPSELLKAVHQDLNVPLYPRQPFRRIALAYDLSVCKSFNYHSSQSTPSRRYLAQLKTCRPDYRQLENGNALVLRILPCKYFSINQNTQCTCLEENDLDGDPCKNCQHRFCEDCRAVSA